MNSRRVAFYQIYAFLMKALLKTTGTQKGQSELSVMENPVAKKAFYENILCSAWNARIDIRIGGNFS